MEKVAGQKFEDYVTANILVPLQMNNTGFVYNNNVVSKMALSYIDGQQVPIYDLG